MMPPSIATQTYNMQAQQTVSLAFSRAELHASEISDTLPGCIGRDHGRIVVNDPVWAQAIIVEVGDCSSQTQGKWEVIDFVFTSDSFVSIERVGDCILAWNLRLESFL